MLNWGVLSAGKIAYVFCNAMRFSNTGKILALASRTQARADKFVNDFGISRQYTSYEDLLEDEDIDAVYISTIHPLHAEWAIKSAQAKKHVLVEKPIGLNYVQAAAMVEAARENDVFLMEAFMYRCHPQTQQVVKLIQDGAIGNIHLIRAMMGFRNEFDPQSRIYSQAMGGGGILDLGCYTGSMVRLIAGAVENKPFLNPTVIRGSGIIGPTGVDHIAAATVRFENEIIAEVIATIECGVGRTVSIYGSDGIITLPNPWGPSSPCRRATHPLPLDTTFPPAKIIVQSHPEMEFSELLVPTDRDLFTYEADMVANHIEARQAPAMSWDDSLGNMRLLDSWREEIGIVD